MTARTRSRSTRFEAAASRRAAVSGSGPRSDEGPAPRFPAAADWFALFGEVLLTGVLIAAVSLPLVTIPAGMAAGIRHLRLYIRGEPSPWREFWRDVRLSAVGGAAVGAAGLALVGFASLTIRLAQSDGGGLGIVMSIAGALAVLAVAVLLLLLAALWTPQRRWRGALRAVVERTSRDPIEALYLALAVIVVVVLGVQLLPLVVPALGLAALAVVAVEVRRRKSFA